jgi:hypothetical protein
MRRLCVEPYRRAIGFGVGLRSGKLSLSSNEKRRLERLLGLFFR